MDIQLVCPQLLVAGEAVKTKEGIRRPQTPAESIAVGTEDTVIPVQEMGYEF